MSILSIWFNDKPVQPKYLQVSHNDIGRVLGVKKFEKFRQEIHNHHCQFATKDGMFVIEEFFGRDMLDETGTKISFVMECMIQYVQSRGFEIDSEYYKTEGIPLVKGFDGILVRWSW